MAAQILPAIVLQRRAISPGLPIAGPVEVAVFYLADSPRKAAPSMHEFLSFTGQQRQRNKGKHDTPVRLSSIEITT